MDNQKTIAVLVQEFNVLDTAISELDAKSKKLKAERDEIEREIVAYLTAEGSTMSAVGNIVVSIEEKRHPQVKDWDAFYAYLHEHNAYYLLQRRVSSTAIKELAELGDIPGVSFYDEVVLKTRTRR